MNKLKKSIQENGGFRQWFVNVFWFHYKWPLLVAVAVLGIVTFITVDSLSRERFDTTIVIATDYYVDEEMLAALDDVLTEVVEDIDGNGTVNIAYALLYVDENNEVGRQNQERMYLYMTQEDVALYLMSSDVSEAYTHPQLEYFTDPVANYGLEADPYSEVRVDLTENELLISCGLEDIYLSIMDYTTVSGSNEAEDAVEAAIAMAKAITETE